MKFKIILLLLSLFIFKAYSQTDKKERDGFLKDLRIYREIVETSHSGMYLYTPKTNFDLFFKDAKKEINTKTDFSKQDFFRLMAKIHTKINCGHSSFYPSGKLYEELDSTRLALFPIPVKFIKDSLIVAIDFKEIKKGTQLLKINGKTIAQIKTDAFQIISSDGYNQTFKYRQLEEEFTNNYFLLYGPQKKFDLEIIPYGADKSEHIIIDGFTLRNFKSFADAKKQKPYYLSYENDNTVLLTVNTFSTQTRKNQKRFFKFLKESFKEMRNKGVKNLIVDIRENTGGDDGNDMELASYLINKPFKENKFRKLNTLNLPVYPENLHQAWFDMFGISSKISNEKLKNKAQRMFKSDFHQKKDGAYYYKDKSIIKREPAKYLFKGKTSILISGKVFSGGALFSALVRDKSNAVFVGEETGGGYYRHTGSIPFIYTLPHSKNVFSIFIVINEQDVDQQLFPLGTGTKPHFEVYPTIKEFVEGRDAVLEFAKSRF